MSWEDPRLKLNKVHSMDKEYLSLPAYAMEFLWIPDPYITNSKDAGASRYSSIVTIYRPCYSVLSYIHFVSR